MIKMIGRNKFRITLIDENPLGKNSVLILSASLVYSWFNSDSYAGMGFL